MGISGVSLGSLLIILVIVVLLFGTKKLRSMGGDLGAALNEFRKGYKEEDSEEEEGKKEKSLEHSDK